MLVGQSRGSVLQRLVLVRTAQVMSPVDSWALSPSPSPTGGAEEEELVPFRIPGRGKAQPQATSEGIPRQGSNGGKGSGSRDIGKSHCPHLFLPPPFTSG